MGRTLICPHWMKIYFMCIFAVPVRCSFAIAVVSEYHLWLRVRFSSKKHAIVRSCPWNSLVSSWFRSPRSPYSQHCGLTSPLHGSQPCCSERARVTHWSYEPCHAGPPKMDQSEELWQNMVHWRREWQTTPGFLSRKPHEWYEKFWLLTYDWLVQR